MNKVCMKNVTHFAHDPKGGEEEEIIHFGFKKALRFLLPRAGLKSSLIVLTKGSIAVMDYVWVQSRPMATKFQ